MYFYYILCYNLYVSSLQNKIKGENVKMNDEKFQLAQHPETLKNITNYKLTRQTLEIKILGIVYDLKHVEVYRFNNEAGNEEELMELTVSFPFTNREFTILTDAFELEDFVNSGYYRDHKTFVFDVTLKGEIMTPVTVICRDYKEALKEMENLRTPIWRQYILKEVF